MSVITGSTPVNLQQVFAQAKSLFDNGDRWWFSKEEIEIINSLNALYQVETELDDLCKNIFPGDQKISAFELLRLLKGPNATVTQSDRIKLGSILKKKCIKTKREGSENLRFYWIKLPNNHGMPLAK